MPRSRPSDSHLYYAEEERLLQRYASVSCSKNRFHRLAARKSAHRDRLVTISVIILQTITGALTLSSDVPSWAEPIISALQLALAITVAVQSYLKLQQRSEAHRSASVSYGKIHHTLLALLARRPAERPPAPGVVDHYLNSLLELDKNSPMLPLGLCESITKKEGLRNMDAGSRFLPEEVASINSVVEIFMEPAPIPEHARPPKEPVKIPAATPTADSMSTGTEEEEQFHDSQ